MPEETKTQYRFVRRRATHGAARAILFNAPGFRSGFRVTARAGALSFYRSLDVL